MEILKYGEDIELYYDIILYDLLSTYLYILDRNDHFNKMAAERLYLVIKLFGGLKSCQHL